MSFDDATLRAFLLRFDNLDMHIVTEAANWVERLDAREHLENPSAVLESILQKRSSAIHAQNATARASTRAPAHPDAAARDRSRFPASSHADPEVAHRELAKIRRLLNGNPLHDAAGGE